jgi:hypothetical protein
MQQAELVWARTPAPPLGFQPPVAGGAQGHEVLGRVRASLGPSDVVMGVQVPG